MKKLLFILSVAVLAGCNKNDDKVVQPGEFRMSKSIHIGNSNTDTTYYTYSGDDASYKVSYSNTPSIYNNVYTKNGSQYDLAFYTNSTKTHEGFSHLTASGFIDTGRVTNLSTMLFNNRDKIYYDANNYATRIITAYNGYTNDIKKFYSGGNYSYWIYDLLRTNPLDNTKDSVVFEYYLDKPKLTEFYMFESKYGKLEKNLVKKRSTYDLLNSGALKRTYDYQYLTDANGLVTRQVLIIKDQPGNVITSNDTTYYEYVAK